MENTAVSKALSGRSPKLDGSHPGGQAVQAKGEIRIGNHAKCEVEGAASGGEETLNPIQECAVGKTQGRTEARC